ncbi:hypothetical protein [Rubritalea profundi]|uniref:hypothetical protein n=1 Tax=Rubritalea profundi TaxID=1658618 RepID=UPI0019815D3D|nr:hypothetical protein [Rubritalea profundi]
MEKNASMQQSKPSTPQLKSDRPFLVGLFGFTLLYVALIALLVVANASYITWDKLVEAITSDAIQQSLTLTFLTCTVTAILSVIFAVPIGYTLSRFNFRGRTLLDTVLDIPIILPHSLLGSAC